MTAAAETIDAIRKLVEGFRTNLSALRDPQTIEAVVRSEYVDPFWEALGWDVANRRHRNPAEKDVLIEAPVGTIEDERVRNRRPDYLFRIGGFPRFVVEAKKPAVDLKDDKESIFQAKTYAWSAQIPFAILTNFEQFRLYDTTLKPYFDEPSRGLIADFDLRFEDYVNQWDVFREVFSRDAVADGSLERLLAKIKKVRAGRRVRGFDRMLFDFRGTEPVDRVFLETLKDYRLRFARELHAENPSRFQEADTRHGAAELAEATQRLIDRLVFMRVCEDRGIIAYGTLRDTLEEAAANRLDLYSALVGRFREFDARFNGYLFKPHFSEELTVGPDALADFMRSLYPPEGPYRFDAVGDDLLGIIYERFLGSTISVHGREVSATDKPEVRHAGGVYYTPRFVVDTIIRRVVAPQVEGKTPQEVCGVTVLDPACGSGSFLIAAYQYLVDYCVRYVSEHPKAAEVPASSRARTKTRKIAVKGRDGQWLLTPDFKGELLTSCIHGVDIDAQAVEVTVMSLYLKVLENMPEHWQRELVAHQLLPPLDNNIRCGNSLLSPGDFETYWEEKHGGMFASDEDVRFRMNAFDWTSETRGFGRVFAARRGFDCIVGNPPYIRVQELNKWNPEECAFYKSRYKSAAKGNYDIYVVFIERALELLADDGLLGVICPNKMVTKEYARPLRELLVSGKNVREFIDFRANQVFLGATTYTCILTLQKSPNRGKVRHVGVESLEDTDAVAERMASGRRSVRGLVSIASVPHPDCQGPWIMASQSGYAGISQLPQLSTIASVFVGVQTDADDVYYLTPLQSNDRRGMTLVRCEYAHQDYEIESAILRDVITGTNVGRFVVKGAVQKIIFPFAPDAAGRYRPIVDKDLRSRFPGAYKFFHDPPIRARLRARAGSRLADAVEFWDFIYRKNLAKQALPKLCVPRLAESVRAASDLSGAYCLDNVDVCGVIPNDERVPAILLLALLNSRLLDAYMKATIRDNFRGGYLSLNKQYLGLLPIKVPQAAHEHKLAARIIERVERIIEVKTQLQGGLGEHAAERSQREVEALEKRIDELVCELYGVDEVPTE